MTFATPGRMILVAVLCGVAYAPALRLPLISDDWLQIALARDYGPPSGWSALAADPLYRCRATSLVLVSWIDRWFGATAIAYNLTSLLLHIAASWLVLFAGSWRAIGWAVSLPAAAFFAVHEGHQEAVMWSSALPDLLAFLFVGTAVLSFARWAERGGAFWLAGAYGAFVLALASKESGAVTPALFLIPAIVERLPMRRWLPIAPAFAMSAVYVWLSMSGSDANQHYSDGTFSATAPFAWTVLNSFVRLLWIWGVVAAGVLLALRRGGRVFAIASAWAVVCLLPYSFLTYMDRVPSRHVYLASAGLAVMVGAAWRLLPQRRVALALGAVAILHNCGYLWMRKYDQFAARAEPTEQLIRHVRQSTKPIWLRCFPYEHRIAVHAVTIGANAADRLFLGDNPPEGDFEEFCIRPRF